MIGKLLTVFGTAVAIAGGDKLLGDRGYTSMFRHLGWSREAMNGVATAEVVGGMLMTMRATRRLGGAMVAGTSAAVLASELRQNDTDLAAPRTLVLLGALLAVFAPDG